MACSRGHELHRAYEAEDYDLVLELLLEQPKEKVRAIEVCFETDVPADKLAKKQVDLDECFVLCKLPFTGVFHVYLDGEDMMPVGMRRMYPFAYVEWLLSEAHLYMKQSLHAEAGEGVLEHIFAYGHGDSSPEIVLYRDGPSEIISPIFWERPSQVEFGPFRDAVVEASDRAVTMLERNRKFRKSKRLKGMRALLTEIQQYE